MSTIALPLDVMHSILLILPVKSLIRFKTVCKSWNDIISDPDFAKIHLMQSKKSSRNQNIFISEGDEELRLVKFENNKFQVEAIREHHCLGGLLCSSDDGLLLLRTTCSTSYLLWNPSSKQQKIIPRPNSFDRDWKTFGFFHDPISDEYKIVAISRWYYAVFSCRSRVWTEEEEFPYTNYIVKQGGVFVDGLCFFVMFDMCRYPQKIVYFDPRAETFNKLQKPREIKDSHDYCFFLTSLRGCLCLCNDADDGRQFQIWMKSDHNVDSNSWTKYMNFIKPITALGYIGAALLLLTERNELVMFSDYEESEFGIYKSMENRYEKLDICTSMFTVSSSTVVSYVESMFFPIR